MVGNPNHDPKTGEFASGHNAGGGNRAIADHIKKQHADYAISVHNGYRHEYHSTVQAVSVHDARKQFKAHTAGSRSQSEFRVRKLK